MNKQQFQRVPENKRKDQLKQMSVLINKIIILINNIFFNIFTLMLIKLSII